MSTILEIANANKSLTALMKGIKAAGLEEELSGSGPFTIFAPVNLAFSNLDSVSLEDLMKPLNKSRLSAMISHHIIPGKNLVGNLLNGQKLKTVSGQELSVTVKNDDIYINEGKILSSDMRGTNGVVHTINAVNMPQ